MKLIFYLQKNIKYFFKLILSFEVCVARHAQITQNNKFSIPLQCFKKGVSLSYKDGFLHADKDENYL